MLPQLQRTAMMNHLDHRHILPREHPQCHHHPVNPDINKILICKYFINQSMASNS